MSAISQPHDVLRRCSCTHADALVSADTAFAEVPGSGTEHPLREPCRRLVEAVAQGLVEATTTIEVVQQFVHVCGRRRLCLLALTATPTPPGSEAACRASRPSTSEEAERSPRAAVKMPLRGTYL